MTKLGPIYSLRKLKTDFIVNKMLFRSMAKKEVIRDSFIDSVLKSFSQYIYDCTEWIERELQDNNLFIHASVIFVSESLMSKIWTLIQVAKNSNDSIISDMAEELSAEIFPYI
jgi:hypothetical protein